MSGRPSRRRRVGAKKARRSLRGQDLGRAQRTSSARAAESILEGLDRIVRTVRRDRGAITLGTTERQTKRAFPGAARLLITQYVPLAGSFLDPAERLQGSIRWFYDDPDARTPRVDLFEVVLLTGGVERDSVRNCLRAAAKATGLNLEPSGKDSDIWFDVDVKGVDLWVALGDGIVVLSVCRR